MGTGNLAFVIAGLLAARPAAAQSQEWPVYGGDNANTRYTRLTGIDSRTVTRLAPVWTWSTGEKSIPRSDSTLSARPGSFEATPIMVGDTLFLSTPYHQVVALDGATGRELWRYDPGAYRWGWGPSRHLLGYTHRGVAMWTDGRSRRIFINSRWRLIALDASTGRPIPTFGNRGEVDLTANLSRPTNRRHYGGTSPPLVFENLVIAGSSIEDELVYPNDPPGDVQAFDARTGRHVWTFQTVPAAGQFGSETWQDHSNRGAGHVNVWAPMTVDTTRGLLYLPVSAASNDYYGGRRKGPNLFAESLVCLDARTGRRIWHYQIVHHGVWDYDLPSAPVLATTRPFGSPLDIVAVATKTGFVYVFDRVTGRPVWPIEERPVPPSDVPGEVVAPTQPFPTRPAPFARQGFGPADVVDFTPEIRALALDELKKYVYGPIFTPPSRKGTIVMPGWIGGAGWGGPALDPTTGVLYVKATNLPSRAALFQAPASAAEGYTIQPGLGLNVRVPYRQGFLARFRKPRFATLPLQKPPYGTLTAIDLNSGEHLWQVPLGDLARVRNSPALRSLRVPPLGHPGTPGGFVTASGLIFLTGGSPVLYAIDVSDGRVLWQADLGQNGNSVPMTYRTRSGRQFVVVATGEGATARLVAFALPAP
jgi:quinoprotein glucose dehydrogenase